ncbi:GntR family transcriptional regulator [Rhizobium sp. KVB221]|uniref:GntR family transcriptional regulator n=1 Tax=Rhizobium setariae TaxID=2801340 RepID=A0A937CQ73_9HYPH|nr:GntR family transcriptional regulator [Rhizobium setariae]MBL0373493.1 GntR family transcriptional regulator [Rhizobium setariae]
MNKTVSDIASLKIVSPPVTLREIALERMRDAIISGLFAPGQRLVERTLCDQLGVSRSVIREVIRHLQAEGLVDIAKQGPVVASMDWHGARQIYDIRAALESSAVADCARAADIETKDKLRLVLDELDQNSRRNEPPTVLDVTTRFYEIIFAAAGHDIAWEIVSRLNSRISRLRVMTLSTTNRSVSGPAQLREIFAAIERNDPDAAAKACREHIAAAARLAESLLQKED